MNELRPLVKGGAVVPAMPVSGNDAPVGRLGEEGSEKIDDGVFLSTAEAIDEIWHAGGGTIGMVVEHGDLWEGEGG